MKFLIGLLALQPWFATSGGASQAVHGMVLFGEQSTYASHLPLFHSPHNYQVILKIQLIEPAGSQALDTYQKKRSQELFTLVPERMDLNRVISGEITRFRAEIYRGHFERGGKNLGPVTVSIETVVFSRRLETVTEDEGSYVIFGSQGEYFGLHLIHDQPSFDALVSVEQPYEIKTTDCRTRRGCTDLPISVPDARLPVILSAATLDPPQVQQSLGKPEGPLAEIQKVIYLEQEDLE